MKDLHDLAQLLISCWVLSDETDRAIPTSHSILDRAIKTACAEDAFPEWAREKLHFADSRIGLQCVELGSLLDLAQKAELTTAPNPSYQNTVVQISPRVARILVTRLGVAVEDALTWGKALREGVATARANLESFPDTSNIEAY